MLTQFSARESVEHIGEVAIYAMDGENRRTVFIIVSRDALADIWGTDMLV